MAQYEHLSIYKKAMAVPIHFKRIIKNFSLMPLLCVLVLCCDIGYAGNIDPDNDGSKFAYGENVGWINFAPAQEPGAVVSNTGLTGYAWGENIGWINLSPINGGVINDGAGNLSGYAWGENVGWINFAPTTGGVTIDPATGVFSGYAWGENIGWINFAPTSGGVKTSWSPDIDDECATFDFFSNTLHVPCFNLGNTSYWLDLSIVPSDAILLELKNFGDNGVPGNVSECASYNFLTNTFHIPCFNLEGTKYWLDLSLVSYDPIQLQLNNYGQ